MAEHFYFTLDKDNFNRLDWGNINTGGGSADQPTLTNEQAQIVAVASIALALDNIALQLHQALGPLQEIADNLQRSSD